MAESGAAAACLGPIPQAAFLLGLGIEQRLEALLAGATPQQADALRAGYRCGAVAGGRGLAGLAWRLQAYPAPPHLALLLTLCPPSARPPLLLRRLVGESEPGAALTEEGMGSSYQAFCIAQAGLQPWPFGAVSLEGNGSGSGSDGEGGSSDDEPCGGAAAEQQRQQRPDGGGQPGA